MITVRAENEQGVKLTATMRTSGTEPKIKYYLEAQASNPTAADTALRNVESGLGDWLQYKHFGFEMPNK